MTWGICKKAMDLGAKVITLSGPDGYVYDPDGVSTSEEKVEYLLEMRASGRNRGSGLRRQVRCGVPSRREALGREGRYHHALRYAERRPHGAGQEDAPRAVKYYIEVANMPTTNDALAFLMQQKHMIVAPSKAVNAGGVGVSAPWR